MSAKFVGMTPEEVESESKEQVPKKRRSLGLSRKSSFKSPIIYSTNKRDNVIPNVSLTNSVTPDTDLALHTGNDVNTRTKEKTESTSYKVDAGKCKQSESWSGNNKLRSAIEGAQTTCVTPSTPASKSANFPRTEDKVTALSQSHSSSGSHSHPGSSINRASHLSTPSSSRKRPSTQRNIFGKKFRTDFKSPLRNVQRDDSPDDIQESIDSLRKKIKSVDDQIKNLEESGYTLKEAQTRITKLHEYNELKDLGQFLIGQIASKEGTTTKQVYRRFDLDLDD